MPSKEYLPPSPSFVRRGNLKVPSCFRSDYSAAMLQLRTDKQKVLPYITVLLKMMDSDDGFPFPIKFIFPG
jgi:hypothetical protein